MTTVLGVIPARGNSTRFPRKNIALLDGEPLVLRAARIALSSTLDKVVVSTENDEIAEIARQYASVIKRPQMLSMDSVMTREVLAHAANDGQYDYVMCLQPDVPFRTSADINAMIEIALGRDADFVGSFMPVNQAVTHIDEDGAILNRAFLDRAETFKPAGIGEIYRVTSLLSGAAYEKAYAYLPPRLSYAVDIDEPEDLMIAQAILDAQRIRDAQKIDQEQMFHRLVSA